MPAKTSSARTAGRRRIDPEQDDGFRGWAERFGITPDQLRAAVEAVGPRAEDVEKYLSRKSGPA